MGMDNNPITSIDPDGRCTECPDGIEVGGTFTNSYGETFTMTKNGWGSSGGAVGSLDTVVIGGGSSINGAGFNNNIMELQTLGKSAIALNLNGNVVVPLASKMMPTVTKADFLTGTFDFRN